MSNKKEIIDLINDDSFSDKEAVEIIEKLVGSIEHEEPEKPTEKQLFGGDRLKKLAEIESKKLLNDEELKNEDNSGNWIKLEKSI